MAKNQSFFNRLTRLFRSGTALRRKTKGYDQKNIYDKEVIYNNYGQGPFPFKREQSAFSMLGTYNIVDRMNRYAEFAKMDSMPEITTALNVFADEVVSGDDKGKAFHIFTDNPEIKKALEELFYDVCNVEFNLRPWARNLCKYGDVFIKNDVQEDVGIINVMPIPVNEIEREEFFDSNDPFAVRFKWIGRGQTILENWQMTHMRLLGNEMFLPLGTSILEGARRTYEQLTLMEDAMLTYRVVRSPERRVFYIDVSNVAPNDIPNYMEQVKSALRSETAVDRNNGRTDFRYNPQTILDDFWIPIRGQQQGTRIETLVGGQHVSAIEDVEYLQKKLTSALGVPRPYLGYEEALGSKATLSQLDVRFSRNVSMIQKVIISELNKMAIIHLFAKGFDGQDLIDFELRLSNPSTVAMQQKLLLWKTRFEIADQAKGEDGARYVGSDFIRKEILGFTGDQVEELDNDIERDKIRALALDALKLPIPPEKQQTTDSFDSSNYEINQTTNNNQLQQPNQQPSSSFKIGNDDNISSFKTGNTKELPVKASPYVKNTRRNYKRRVTDGSDTTAIPDTNRMFDVEKSPSYRDIYDNEYLNNPFKEGKEFTLDIKPSLSGEIDSILKKFESKHPNRTRDIIIEIKETEEEKEVSILKEDEILEMLNKEFDKSNKK